MPLQLQGFKDWVLEYHTLIFFLKGTIMKYKFILFLPGCLKAQKIYHKHKSVIIV